MIFTEKKKKRKWKEKTLKSGQTLSNGKNRELMKEMQKEKTKRPNYNMPNRATLEHRSSSYLSCNTTKVGRCVRLLYLLAIEKD